MKYDLIVVGGGTAGCTCAYTAGKLGLKTLLIEKNSYLGGTMTSALVTPAMKTVSGINNDFYNILMNKLHKIGGQITYSDGNSGWFNPELMKIVLDELMQEVGVKVLFNTEINDVKAENHLIKSVKILSEYIETNNVVDSTGNCDFSQKINCEFLENKNNFQPMNLRFIMSGIDIERFAKFIMELDSNRDVTTSSTIDGQTHLSTAYTWDTNRDWALRPLFKQAIADGVLKEEDSNYFQLFTIPGMPNSIAFNAPRIINKKNNPLDIEHSSNALIMGRKSIFNLANFCKKYLKGFENSYISSIANSLGIRNSRQIRGKYVYTIDDLRTGKKFDNPVLVSDYPVDIHSSEQNQSTLEKQKPYYLPIEALMSNDYDNLFVAGRNLSADFEAQAALRIIPSCFSMGEAVAKYIAQQANAK